jgi:hypothetical protein
MGQELTKHLVKHLLDKVARQNLWSKDNIVETIPIFDENPSLYSKSILDPASSSEISLVGFQCPTCTTDIETYLLFDLESDGKQQTYGYYLFESCGEISDAKIAYLHQSKWYDAHDEAVAKGFYLFEQVQAIAGRFSKPETFRLTPKVNLFIDYIDSFLPDDDTND